MNSEAERERGRRVAQPSHEGTYPYHPCCDSIQKVWGLFPHLKKKSEQLKKKAYLNKYTEKQRYLSKELLLNIHHISSVSAVYFFSYGNITTEHELLRFVIQNINYKL